MLLDSYLTPSRVRSWRYAETVHGISPDFIFAGNFPTPAGLEPKLWDLLDGQRVVIYNASFAGNFLARAWPRFPVYATCCMNRYARHVGESATKVSYVTGYKSWKLVEAAAATDYVWTTRPHSALGDALATRHIWQFLDKQAQSDQV